MRVVVRIARGVALAFALLGGGAAHAGPSDLTAEASDDGEETTDEGPTIINCDDTEIIVARNGRYEEDGDIFMYIDIHHYRFSPDTGEAWVRVWETCDWSDGSTTSGSVWRLISDPDPVIIIGPAYDRVVREVEPPVPDLSPTGPGVVNLGMWLATAEPVENPIVARAQAGSNWAEVTGRLVSTTFDLGNGDAVTCDGFGTPIPDSELDSIEAGPCGYTYETTSGDSPFTITVTSTWSVNYVLSDGRTGSRPDIVLSTEVPYEVREIQTVGTRG